MALFMRRALQCYGSQGHKRKRKRMCAVGVPGQILCGTLCIVVVALMLLLCSSAVVAAAPAAVAESNARFAFKGWSLEEAELDGIGYAPAAVPVGRYIFVLGGITANSSEEASLDDFVLHQTGRAVNVFDFFTNAMRPARRLTSACGITRGDDGDGCSPPCQSASIKAQRLQPWHGVGNASTNAERTTATCDGEVDETVRLAMPAVGANSAVQLRSGSYILGCCNVIPEHVQVQSAFAVDGNSSVVGMSYLLSVQRLRLYATARPGADDVTVRVESWSLPPDMALRYNASCVSNGKDLVYIIGGIDAVTGTELDTVAQYNVTSHVLVDAVVSLGRRVVSPAVLSHSELIYIAGGFSRGPYAGLGNATPAVTSETVAVMDTTQRVLARELTRYWPHSLGWTAPQLFMYERTMLVMGNTGSHAYDRLVYWDDLSSGVSAVGRAAGLPFRALDIDFAPARQHGVLVAVPLTVDTMRFYLFGGQVPPSPPRGRGGRTVADIFSGVLSVPPRPVPKELYIEGFTYYAMRAAGEGVRDEEDSAHVPNNGENVTILVNGYIPVWYNTTFNVLLSNSVIDACPGLLPEDTTSSSGRSGDDDGGASDAHATSGSSNCSFMLTTSPQCDVPLVHITHLGAHNTRRQLIDALDMHGQVSGKVEVVSVGWLTLIGSLRDGLVRTRMEWAAPRHAADGGDAVRVVMTDPDTTVFYPQVFLFACFSRDSVTVRPGAAREVVAFSEAGLPSHSSAILQSSFYFLLNGPYPFILSPVTEWMPNPQPTPGPLPALRHWWPLLRRAVLILLPLLTLIVVAVTAVVQRRQHRRLRRHRADTVSDTAEAANDDGGDQDAAVRQRLLSFALEVGGEEGDAGTRRGREAQGRAWASAVLDGKYRVLRRLGRGSFSVVYLVRRLRDGAEFALKYVQCPDNVDPREAIKECEVAYLLQGHPSVITIVDMFMSYKFDAHLPPAVTVEGEGEAASTAAPATSRRGGLTGERYLSLVMAYHEDGDLGHWVQRRKLAGLPIAEATIVSIAAQVLSLLCHMHSRDPPIVHRDLKPENILLSRRSYDDVSADFLPIVVTDFGLARFMDKTFCETGVGSLPYMAPECWQRRYSTKVDIWALGCILYAVAMRSVESNNVKIMFSESARPGFSRKLRTELRQVYGYSKAFASLVTLLLKVNPDSRPSAAEALRCIDRHPITTESCVAQAATCAAAQTVAGDGSAAMPASRQGREKDASSGSSEAAKKSNFVIDEAPMSASKEGASRARQETSASAAGTGAALPAHYFTGGVPGVRYELFVSLDHCPAAEMHAQAQQVRDIAGQSPSAACPHTPQRNLSI